jgi:hypothetical protein
VSGRGKAAVTALVVLLVVAVVTGVLLWRQNADLRRKDEIATAETQATRAASRIAVSMTSYDYRSVKEDFAWVRRDGTKKFEDTYAQSTRPIQQLIERTRATATGKVSNAAGTADDATHVTVLLFVDQAIRRPGDKQPSVEPNRVVMDMVKQGGRWLVDDVELG